MQKVIDIHCHMFNLKYLPVAGILRRYSKNNIPHLIAIGIEWLLIKNTSESYPDKNKILIKNYKPDYYNTPLYKFLGEKAFTYKIQDVFDFKYQDSVTAIEHMALVGDVLEGELSNALDEFEKINKAELGNFYKSKFINEEDKIKYRAGLLRRMLNWIIKKFKELINYLKWFVFMTNSEESIYKYITTRDEVGVEKYLHLMMDVDHFFNEDVVNLKYKSYFDFEKEQINNMRQLNGKHSNLMGFVAFNPARNNCMEIIEKAINENGFKGVKFYPPLGYRADGDPNYSEQIERLFTYCSANKLPVFTHCNNEGFEALPGGGHSGYNSNPKYWELALGRHPDLILCLGHAGGSEGWFCENKNTDKLLADSINAADIKDETCLQKLDWNNSYASLVFKLCVKYDNVYCDASYLDDMVESDGSTVTAPKDNFRKRLVKLFDSEPKFRCKIMYGSDWHMLFQEGKNNVYLKSYLELFSENELAHCKDDFFYNNAMRFLNLISAQSCQDQ